MKLMLLLLCKIISRQATFLTLQHNSLFKGLNFK
jgi:hypothetical protein